MSYRYDLRTKEEFKEDIKFHHICEAEIAIRICQYLYDIEKVWPTLETNGTDASGKFINNTKKITHAADYLINSIPVEITRADTLCKRYFHEKISKVKRCIKDGSSMVFVNGYKIEKEPKFIIMSAGELEDFTILAEKKYGLVRQPGRGNTGLVNKLAYRYDLSLFNDDWKVLPELAKRIPKSYKNILKMSIST